MNSVPFYLPQNLYDAAAHHGLIRAEDTTFVRDSCAPMPVSNGKEYLLESLHPVLKEFLGENHANKM